MDHLAPAPLSSALGNAALKAPPIVFLALFALWSFPLDSPRGPIDQIITVHNATNSNPIRKV